MKKSELIETVIALDPSRKAEDLEALKVDDLTALVSELNDKPAEPEEESKGEEKPEEESKGGLFVAEKSSISVGGRILGPGDEVPEKFLVKLDVEKLIEKGVLAEG